MPKIHMVKNDGARIWTQATLQEIPFSCEWLGGRTQEVLKRNSSQGRTEGDCDQHHDMAVSGYISNNLNKLWNTDP